MSTFWPGTQDKIIEASLQTLVLNSSNLAIRIKTHSSTGVSQTFC